jgi:hypothetical protein
VSGSTSCFAGVSVLESRWSERGRAVCAAAEAYRCRGDPEVTMADYDIITIGGGLGTLFSGPDHEVNDAMRRRFFAEE